jgi:recombination protein RecR
MFSLFIVMKYPKAFRDLITHLSGLPSVGPKMAERLTLFLFKQDHKKIRAFAESLENLTALKPCARCFSVAEEEFCSLCADEHRDTTVVLVVEEPLDVLAFERTNTFTGLYHVLGGVLDVNRPELSPPLRIAELLARVRREGVKEVIIATNPTTEGDATAFYLKQKLQAQDVKISRLARGLATGGDIEYADEATLSASLANRAQM